MRRASMTRFAIWVIAVGAFVTALHGAAMEPQGESVPPSASTAPQQTGPTTERQAGAAPIAVPGEIGSYRSAVVDRYCVGCHNDRTKAANLSLQGIDLANVAGNPEVYAKLEKMVLKLRARAMPPQGMPRPDAATLQRFVVDLETS